MRGLRAWLVLAVAVVLTGLWLVPANAVTQTANVVARDVHGRVLPPDPLLKVGDRIQLTITGFGPRAHLTVRLGTTVIGSYVADPSGTVRFYFVVPGHLGKGDYVVAAVGTPPLGRSPSPSHESGNPTYDPQGIETQVPTLGIFTFKLDPGHTSPPPTTSHPPSSSSGGGSIGGSGGSSGSGGGLGHTGVNVIGLLIAAAVGIVGGLLIWLPGRRRRHA